MVLMYNGRMEKNMKLLSVCAITRNEGERIEKFINMVKDWSDEIVIIDNQSEDDTFTIAESNGCRVFQNNENSLDLARNKYIQNAAGKWIIVLDLDEEILDVDFKGIRNEIELAGDDVGGYYLPIQHYFGEGHWALTYNFRIFKKLQGVVYSRACS